MCGSRGCGACGVHASPDHPILTSPDPVSGGAVSAEQTVNLPKHVMSGYFCPSSLLGRWNELGTVNRRFLPDDLHTGVNERERESV